MSIARQKTPHRPADGTDHDHGVTERELQDLLRFVHSLGICIFCV